tara:strand:- start:2175 stop:2387 length:213 start_codon:yes stop_codon:yes gene_type:complete
MIDKLMLLLRDYYKVKRHKRFMINYIFLLRNEILHEALLYNDNNTLNCEAIKNKALLIKKYSKRLRLLNM